MTATAPPGPTAAVFEVVKNELDRVQASCEARSNGVDTKAGLILAAVGVLIGLRASDPTLLDVLAALVALGAGGYAVYALRPRQGSAVSPRVLYEAPQTHPGVDVQDQMIRGRLDVWEADEKALDRKAERLNRAVIWLAASAVLFIISSVWKMSTDGSPSPAVPAPSPTKISTPMSPSTSTTGLTAHAGTSVPQPLSDTGLTYPRTRSTNMADPAPINSTPIATPTGTQGAPTAGLLPGLIVTVTKGADPSGAETR